MKQSQYNQVHSVQGHPNICGTFVLKKFTVIKFSQNRALSEITWKNMVEPDRAQMTIQ